MSDVPPDPTAAVPAAPADAPDPAAIADDYRRLTAGAGLLDRSEDGKLALTGTEARAFLTGQVTADVEALQPGHGTYAALLTPKGKVVADLRVLDVGEPDRTELLLICERSGLQALFDHLRRHLIGFDVELHKRTVQQSLHAVIGPRADGVLGDAAAALPRDEHASVRGTLDGVDVLLVRTDLGIDVVAEAERGPEVLAALVAHGAAPVAPEAVEVLRVEHGRPRLHHELDETVMPAEAGIVERAVSFTKGCYVGQETVARLHWRGRPNRHLRGLALDRWVPVGTVIVGDGRELGRVTTSVDSPALGPIALALVRREVEPDATVVLRPTGGEPTSGRVVALPFSRAGGGVTA
jgi:folate-binding protein YgfZ